MHAYGKRKFESLLGVPGGKSGGMKLPGRNGRDVSVSPSGRAYRSRANKVLRTRGRREGKVEIKNQLDSVSEEFESQMETFNREAAELDTLYAELNEYKFPFENEDDGGDLPEESDYDYWRYHGYESSQEGQFTPYPDDDGEIRRDVKD